MSQDMYSHASSGKNLRAILKILGFCASGTDMIFGMIRYTMFTLKKKNWESKVTKCMNDIICINLSFLIVSSANILLNKSPKR